MADQTPQFVPLPPDVDHDSLPSASPAGSQFTPLPPDAQLDAPPQPWQSSLWPVSGSGEPGNIRFDPHAGIIGSMVDAFTLPGDVYTGKQPTPYSGGNANIVNPEIPSPDTALFDRTRNLALTISPTSIGSPAVTPKLPPAVQTLRGAGAQPTPGAVGGLPWLGEEALSRIPFAGAPVNAGRAAAQQQLEDTLAKLPAGPARNTLGQFVAGPSNTAIRNNLIIAGQTLPAASSTHGGGVIGVGGLLGAGAISGLLQNPESLTHLLHAVSSPEGVAGLAAAGIARPLLAALYSEPGRQAITGLLGAARAIPTVPLRRYGPMGAQLVSGLLNQNEQGQP